MPRKKITEKTLNININKELPSNSNVIENNTMNLSEQSVDKLLDSIDANVNIDVETSNDEEKKPKKRTYKKKVNLNVENNISQNSVSSKENIVVNENVNQNVEEVINENIEEVVNENVEEVVNENVEEVVNENVEEVVNENVEEVVNENVEEVVNQNVEEVVNDTMNLSEQSADADKELLSGENSKDNITILGINDIINKEQFSETLVKENTINLSEQSADADKENTECISLHNYLDEIVTNNEIEENNNDEELLSEANAKDIITDITKAKYVLDNEQIDNILHENSITPQKNSIDLSSISSINDNATNQINKKPNSNYTLDDLRVVFNKFQEAILLVQILDGNVTFIEKKGFESRNQSIIDLLIKANKYKKLPDIQTLFYTNDFIEDNLLTKCPYLYTFCKKYSYDTQLFPNFSFNHWNEASIGDYQEMYNYFINNNVEWNNKQNLIFWTGSIKTNIIRKKIHTATKDNNLFFINAINERRTNNIPITEINKYKFLLNMNGYSYGGRLNYLFMSGSCVIILKNEDKEKTYNEYFYDQFIPGEDYIEVVYNDNEDGKTIVKRIVNEMSKVNPEEMAKRCLNKAIEVFKMDTIYEYIYQSISNLSKKSSNNSKLENSTMFIPPLNNYFKNRLKNDVDSDGKSINSLKFNYQGSDFDILLYNNNDKLKLKIMGDSTKVFFNDYLVLDKYTPFILNPNKTQYYQVKIDGNNLSLIIENKFRLVNVDIPNNDFVFTDCDIKSDNGGWCIILN